MKFVPLLALFVGASSQRGYYVDDAEGSETTVPVGIHSNFADGYGGDSFIGRTGGIGYGNGNLGYQRGLGFHQGFGEHRQGLGGVGFHQGLGGGGFQRGFIGGGGNVNQLGHGVQGGYIGSGFGGAGAFGSGFVGHHGGGLIDQSSYNSGKKNLEDGSYEKSSGNRIAELNQGENGFAQGNVGQQSSKGDLGYFNDQQAAQKVQEDGKVYNGGQHFNQQGQNANENKQQLGHKKGHVTKGFKSSHHKDETGKTEEYYDEAHDEGDNINFQGQAGKFGEGSQLSFKGGHDDSFYNADEKKNQGHYNGQQYVDKNNADRGQYGQNKYIGNGQAFGVNNGVDQQALLGHQEHSRFYKHHPYHSHFYR